MIEYRGAYPKKPKSLSKIAMILSSGDPDMYDGALFSFEKVVLFIAAEGINEEGPILFFRDINMSTRFTCGAREFVNRWSECGPTHYFAAASGRHSDTIQKVAKIFNVPITIVTR